MKYTLNDIERTLLSAYMDGELPPADAAHVDALLERSAEARRYLDDLRAVGTLSVATLGAVTSTAAPAVTMKLTGGAIEAAARKAIAAKAAAGASWAVIGTIGVVTSVAVGVALSLRSPEPNVAATYGHRTRPAATAPAAPGVVAAGAIDTTNLVVPPMSTSDLMAFAVHGTLPIDAGRKRFLTVASKGRDSMALEVHHNTPGIQDDRLAALHFVHTQALDSIEGVVRTAVLHSKDGLVLRADFPTLRLDVIRTLRRAVPTMPTTLRAQLERTRVELSALAHDVDEDRGDIGDDDAMGAPVLYRMIPLAPLTEALGEDNQSNGPIRIVIGGRDDSFISFDRRSLRTLEAHVRLPVPPMPTAVAVAEANASQQISSNPAGVRVVRRALPPQRVRIVRPDNDNSEQHDSAAGERVHLPNAFVTPNDQGPNVVIRNDNGIEIQIDASMNTARESLHTADSLLEQLRRAMRERMMQNSGDAQSSSGNNQSGANVNTGSAPKR